MRSSLRPALRQLSFAILAAGLALHVGFSHAERADRSKPLRILADYKLSDDSAKVLTLEGNVRISQGTLLILADKAVITQGTDGFERAIATSKTGVVRIQQKREGKDEMIYAEGERVEYDTKTEIAKLIRRAWVKMGRGDEACADYIEYNGYNETYQASKSKDGSNQQIEIIVPGRGDGAASVPAAAPINVACERRQQSSKP
ncbi:MAG: lipopolysaccharide transport periplasmic protein LptA [Rhodocyclaceae bacterium]